jgi:hypothetical protein
LHSGRLVAEPRSHPRVAALMDAQRKDEQNEFEQGKGKGCRLQANAPG